MRTKSFNGVYILVEVSFYIIVGNYLLSKGENHVLNIFVSFDLDYNTYINCPKWVILPPTSTTIIDFPLLNDAVSVNVPSVVTIGKVRQYIAAASGS